MTQCHSASPALKCQRRKALANFLALITRLRKGLKDLYIGFPVSDVPELFTEMIHLNFMN